MMKKTKLFMTVILAAAMVLTACSGSTPAPEASSEPKTEAEVSSIPEKETEAPTTTAPTTEAPTTEAPTTEAPTTEALTQTEPADTPADPVDFDPATNNTFNVMGIEFQVPARWVQSGNAFYADGSFENQAVLIYISNDSVSADMISNPVFVSSYADGLKSSFQEDAEVISSELTEVAGREMILSKLRGKTNGIEMVLDAASMAAPGGQGLVAFLFAYAKDGAVDYTGDFRQILENLKDAEEVPSTEEPATEAPTTEAASEAESGETVQKRVSHSFDPATNERYTVKGIEFQIPVSWVQNDPYFYPSIDVEQFAMVYYSAPETASASMLDNAAFVESYAQGMASSVENGKLIDFQMTEIAGRKMLIVDLEGDISGMDMEMTFATMAAPADDKLVVLGCGQRIHGEVDYMDDFLKILENLKDAGN